MPWSLGRPLPRPSRHRGGGRTHIRDSRASAGGVLTEPLALPLFKGAVVGWPRRTSVLGTPGLQCVPGCVPEHGRRGKAPFPCSLGAQWGDESWTHGGPGPGGGHAWGWAPEPVLVAGSGQAPGLSPASPPPVLLRAHPEGGHAPPAQPLGPQGAPVARPPWTDRRATEARGPAWPSGPLEAALGDECGVSHRGMSLLPGLG